MSEINSIPAILDIKVSNKNFQPMIDHKKKKKKEDRREAFEIDETGTFFGFSSKPFHQWGIQWILKTTKESRLECGENYPDTGDSERKKKKTQLAIYFFSPLIREK